MQKLIDDMVWCTKVATVVIERYQETSALDGNQYYRLYKTPGGRWFRTELVKHSSRYDNWYSDTNITVMSAQDARELVNKYLGSQGIVKYFNISMA